MTSQEQRERIFEACSANLAAFAPEYSGLFVCPVCRVLFDRTALQEPLGLTLEHCIPRALGRSLVTLTCKQCNNRAGTELDAHLARRLDFADFLQGEYPRLQRGWFTIDGRNVRADIKIELDKTGKPAFSVYFRGDHSNPSDFQAVLAALHSANNVPGGLRMQMSSQVRVKLPNSRIALLRMGLLTMFQCFGYGYILNPHVEQVRQQILHPERETIAGSAIIRLNAPAQLNSVVIVTEPEEHKCFLVPIVVSTGGRRHGFGVLLPGLDDDSGKIYDRVQAAREKGEAFKAQFSTIAADLGTMPRPDERWRAYEIWRAIVCGETITENADDLSGQAL